METTSGPISGDAAALVGRLLDDRYRLESVIAKGGMAAVYQAVDTRLDRIVAVKVMHRALAEDPDFVRRFTREAQASAKLSTPEVVAIHDTGTDRDTGLAYLVMEHVRGINLRQLLLERGALPPARAVAIMEPVLRALAAAHAANLVHRDVKPENVLLADDGRVKVADFGLARAVETSTMTQTTGLLIGTVAYLAPEQVESGTADARTDVYAAGVLLWELLTGTPPHAGDTPMSVAYKHVNEDVPAPSTVASGIPPELDALVVRATRRDPDARPADGAAFLAELVAVKAGLPPATAVEHRTLVVPITPPPPKKVPKVTPSPRRRRRGLIATAIILVLALLALGGGYYLGSYRYTNAPSVLTKTLTEATKTLQDEGLKFERLTDRFSEDVPRGLVMDQDPDPNKRVRKGGTVEFTLSKGPDRRIVPAVRDKSVADARAALKAVGLVDAPNPTREFSSSVDIGDVIRTDPAAGTKLKPGTPVRLFISKGRQPIEVPSFVGKKFEEANGKLRTLGFEVKANYVFSDTEKDVVLDQQPKGGTAPKGSTITLTVSKGPDLVEVPDVTNMKPDRAKEILEAAGFKAERRDAPFGRGRNVYATDPSAGTKAKRGSTVEYYVT